ncbi:MAG: thioesterase family protein [Dehalococcoidia bacterium]
MSRFESGITASRTLLVEGDHLYSPSGKEKHAVLSSPAMIMEMELACVDATRELLEDTESSVGFHVDVKHLTPAPQGSTVTTTATLLEEDGMKLRFKVETNLGETLIGTGIHRRAIVRL